MTPLTFTELTTLQNLGITDAPGLVKSMLARGLAHGPEERPVLDVPVRHRTRRGHFHKRARVLLPSPPQPLPAMNLAAHSGQMPCDTKPSTGFSG